MDNVKKLLLVVLSILACSNLQAENRVAVKARASEEYLKARSLDESKKIQTYQVLKGRFREGNTVDPTLDKISFEEIVLDMAVHLRRQGYYPLAEPGDSDLLIVSPLWKNWLRSVVGRVTGLHVARGLWL